MRPDIDVYSYDSCIIYIYSLHKSTGVHLIGTETYYGLV